MFCYLKGTRKAIGTARGIPLQEDLFTVFTHSVIMKDLVNHLTSLLRMGRGEMFTYKGCSVQLSRFPATGIARNVLFRRHIRRPSPMPLPMPQALQAEKSHHTFDHR